MKLGLVSILEKTLIASLLVMFTASVSSAEDAGVVVGYVDLQRALSSSVEGKKAQKEYEKKVKSVQAELDKKKSEYTRMRSEFSKQKDSLNDSARTDRQEKLIVFEKDLKRKLEDSQASLRRENVKVVGSLLKKLRGVVNEVGREDGFTVILERSAQAVLYADNDIDITDRVIKRFDTTN